MIVSLSVLFQFSGKKIEVAKVSTETIAPQAVEKVLDQAPVKNTDDFIVERGKSLKQPAERKIIKVSKVVQPVARQNKLIAQNGEVKKPTVILTKEEKFAYDQLMLALSVTSSTFKKVKDKVEGVEEKNAVRKSGR